MATPQNQKLLIGEAAEHLVISRLMLNGYVASQAPRTWKADDILIDRGPSIQVKATKNGAKSGWPLGVVEPVPGRWFAFVDFKEPQAPRVYVLSSAAVREATDALKQAVQALHPHWKDIGFRKLHDPCPVEVPGYGPGWLKRYEDAWDQLPPPVTT